MQENTKYTVFCVETQTVEFQKAVEDSKMSGLSKNKEIALLPRTLLESSNEQLGHC